MLVQNLLRSTVHVTIRHSQKNSPSPRGENQPMSLKKHRRGPSRQNVFPFWWTQLARPTRAPCRAGGDKRLHNPKSTLSRRRPRHSSRGAHRAPHHTTPPWQSLSPQGTGPHRPWCHRPGRREHSNEHTDITPQPNPLRFRPAIKDCAPSFLSAALYLPFGSLGSFPKTGKVFPGDFMSPVIRYLTYPNNEIACVILAIKGAVHQNNYFL